MLLQTGKLQYQENGAWIEVQEQISLDVTYVNVNSRPKQGRTGVYTNESIDSVMITFKSGYNTLLDSSLQDVKIPLKFNNGALSLQGTFIITDKVNKKDKESGTTITTLRFVPDNMTEFIIAARGGEGGAVNDVEVDGISVVHSGVAEIELTPYAKKTDVQTELAKKVDKQTTTTDNVYLYGYNKSGDTSSRVTTAASGSTVAMRGTNGVLAVGTPTADSHATTKNYVDNKTSTIATDLANEVIRASNAENTLSTDLSTEESERKAADITLEGKISTEETRAKAAEEILEDYCDSLDATKQKALPEVIKDRYLHTNATTGNLEWSTGGGGGEPAAYIIDITKVDNKYTASRKDGTTIDWTIPNIVIDNYYTKLESDDKFLTKTVAESTYANKTTTEEAIAKKSTVSVSSTGTSENEVKYIKVDGTEYKLAGGSTGDYVDLTSDQTIGGNKEFTNDVKVGKTELENIVVPTYKDWLASNPMPMTDDTSIMQAWVKASETEKARIEAIQAKKDADVIGYIDYGSDEITKYSGSTTDTALFKSEADTKYTTLDTAQTISGAKTFTTAVFVGSTEAGSSRATIEGNNIYISDGSSGDHVNINPTTIESNAEDFSIIVENGEYLSTLTMTAAGALTWKNKNVLTTDDIVDSITSTATDKALSAYSATKLLPLSGGTTTGAIVHSGTSTYALRQSTDTDYLKIAGGITDGKAASIFLYGGLETSNSGVAQIRTSTGTGWGPMLELKPGGSAQWNEKELMTGHLYQHNIQVANTGYTPMWGMTIYNQSQTTLTLTSVAQWLYDNGFTSQTSIYTNCSGVCAVTSVYVATTSGGSVTKQQIVPTALSGVYSTDGVNIRTKANYNGYYEWTASGSDFVDKTITII